MTIIRAIYTFFIVLALSVCVSAEQSPKQQWVATYSGPYDGADTPQALAVDDYGNVYVTGYSDGNDSYPDYATIKYDPNGDVLWLSRYNGPGNYVDRATDLVIDDFGNTYVTGYSDGDETRMDFVTIKYDPNGNQLWAARYDGMYVSWNGYISASDYANALTIDNEGYVYVTGYSSGLGLPDYSTVKYDPNGNEQWSTFYVLAGGGDEARDIAVDSFGNVYVTGEGTLPGVNCDYATVKYDPNGNQCWEALYQYPDVNFSGLAYSNKLLVDEEDYVYVTGYKHYIGSKNCSATVKYDCNGMEMWEAISDPNLLFLSYDMEVDSLGNVFVAGSNTTVIKYDPNGNQVWLSTKEEGTALALALDKSGNIYVTGLSEEDYDVQGYDYTTLKYDPNGNEVWQVKYNGPANGDDRVSDIAINDLGDVCITGYSNDPNDQPDFATIRYTQHDYCIGPIEWDLNSDCKVDFVDITIFAQGWLDEGNLQDLAELCENWLNCGFALFEDCI